MALRYLRVHHSRIVGQLSLVVLLLLTHDYYGPVAQQSWATDQSMVVAVASVAMQ
jgi:hypothetical protein